MSGAALAPAFNPFTLAYAVTVPNSQASVTLTPSLADAGATVQVNGSAVPSGSASTPIDLMVGSNAIAVIVTAEDNTTTKTYTINITRSEAMVVITNPASLVTASTAQLNGSVNPRGSAYVLFEYGTTTAYGNFTVGQSVAGQSPVEVNALLSGLNGGTSYHYRVVAFGSDGVMVTGDDLTFMTSPPPPVAATGSPVAVSSTGATFVGAVNPNGLPAQVRFEYGLTTLYGSSTPIQNIPAGVSLVDVLAPVGGLIAGGTYHCRIVATTAAGTGYGSDVTFVATVGSGTGTGSPTAVPEVTTGSTAAIDTNSAELLGTANPKDGTTVVQFEYGTTTTYGRLTSLQGIGNGNEAAAVSLPAEDLLPGTVYHYRLIATNSLGTSTGADGVFTTRFLPPEVTTGNANALSTTTAGISGSVRASNDVSQVFIDYGTNPALLNNSVSATPASISGNTTTAITAVLANLSQGTTYFYQVRAVNSGGSGVGSIRSFDVGVLSGLFQQFPPEVPLADRQGSVTVNLTPSGIGGGWRFAGEGSWRASGAMATGLTSGDRVIEYRPVAGYLQGPNQTVVVNSAASPIILERAYTSSGSTGSGGLTVTLKPESLAAAELPEASRAQWRLSGESDLQWKNSGVVVTGLVPGDQVIECKTVAGRTTPPPSTAQVSDGVTTVATLTYFVAEEPVGTPPGVLSFASVSSREDRPFAYAGQITSDLGTSSGFVVRPRVVATAGHVMFDDGTLTATTGVQWLFQRERGVHEPAAMIPRGFFLMSGYAAQRAADNSPGTSSPQSQNLDAAALYFLSDAGRGGFSGYLASDSMENEFVMSSALKTLVGYPVDGIAPADVGRMHATPLADISFSPAFGQTYTTSEIRSSGGNSGGPLCIQHASGVYYPAAIYLGGTAQTVVRAIDGDVVDLFGFAEASAGAGVGSTGGTITQSGTGSIGTPTLGAIQVNIQPAAARSAGAGWRIQAQADYKSSGTQLSDLSPNTYTVQFATVSGFVPPSPQSVTIQGGQLTTITFTYEEIISPPVINSPNTITGTRGQFLLYQISAANSPTFFSLQGTLPTGMSFNAGNGRISGTPQEAGNFPVTIGATNAGGSDSRVVNLTCRPVLSAQIQAVPYLQETSYQIVSSESGAGVSYAATSLPDGLILNASTGLITGTPTIPGIFVVPISVTKNGATATSSLTYNITGTVPVITQQPPAGKSVEFGQSTTLTVAASGLPAPTFQWYRGSSGVTNQPINGATSATFTTPPVTANTSYWVRASSISGSANSSATAIQMLPSSNANLANLNTSAGNPSPGFNAGILSYGLVVPYAVSGISLTPEAQVSQSTLEINGAPAASGIANGPLALAVGANSFSIVVTAGDGTSTKTYDLIVTRSLPPSLTTAAATLVTDVSATLNGAVVPNSPVTVFFQYGRTNSYGQVTPGQNVSGTSSLPVQAALSGLSGNAAYHYRIVAMAGPEVFYGDDMTFTTSLERPLAATGNPAGVSTTGATLIGAVNPRGLATSAHFEYGTTPGFGNITPTQPIEAGSAVVDVLQAISGLTAGSTYYYRIVASSDAGVSFGETVSFEAVSGGGSGDGVVDAPPAVATGGTADVTTNSANLLGTVNPREGTTFAFFEYGQTPSYGSTTASKGIGNGNEDANVTLAATGLLPGALYHYRLVATNSLGTTYGADATFTSGYFPPLATTGGAEALSATSARVGGTVRARGTDAEVWFDYGTDGMNFPNSIRAFQPTVGGDLETPVNVDLTNLNSTLTYYYKVRASSSGGMSSGEPRPLHVGALLGLVQEFTREVPSGDIQGEVRVNLLPAGVGGWRFTGESQWRASDTGASGLTSGERQIE